MKKSKEVVEGYYKIPYQGQMRFSVKIVDGELVLEDGGELVFEDGGEKFHEYFGCYITTYQYSEHPERHRHLDGIREDIIKFMRGKETKQEIEVQFKGEFFGTPFEATGTCLLYRLYN